MCQQLNRPERGGRLSAGRGIALCLVPLLLMGCARGLGSISPSPLSTDEQQQALLAIVPHGTARDEARQRLQQAGIEFSTGQSQSVYYCTLWNRPDGGRWQLDVALLFDADGRLYATRRGDSETGIDSAGDAPLAAPAQAPSLRAAATQTEPAGAVVGDAPNSRATRQRTPFAERGSSTP